MIAEARLSERLAAIVDALPLRPGVWVLEIAEGLLSVRQVAAEEFQLVCDEAPFDLAFAIRVGAFDGRHPQAGEHARQHIAAALTPAGRLFIDGGDPLRVVDLGQRPSFEMRHRDASEELTVSRPSQR